MSRKNRIDPESADQNEKIAAGAATAAADSASQTVDVSSLPRGYVLRKLFTSTLYLSAFTFGGGYVIITLLQKKFIDELHWIDNDEMLDLVAIAQSSPGAIAVNGAIVIGSKLAGIPGILCAVLGAVIPPFVILTVISGFYAAFRDNFFLHALLQGMQCGVSAVIFSVVWDMAAGTFRERDKVNLFILGAAFVCNYVLKVNVVFIILACIGVGLIRAVIRGRRSA